MAIVMPTDLGDANVWGPILDTALGTVVDRHDHTTGKGVRIPSAALKINADVSWSDSGLSWSITDLKAVDFTPSAVQTALAGALFVSDGTSSLTANELYWRTTSGVNVKLTAGSALNVAAFTGGFGGDYAAVGALALFDDASESYWFQQQVGTGVRQYARMRSADVDLYEFKAHPSAGVPTNRVRLASPAALAASYDITFPSALPGSTLALQLTSAGILTASNTFSNAVVLSSSLSVGTTLGITGATTLTGLLSANGGVTTQSFVMTGSDTVTHPSRAISIAPAAFNAISTATLLESFIAGSAGGAASGGTYVGYRFGTSGSLIAAIPLRAGDRILTVTAKLVTASGATVSTTVSMQNQSALSSATFTGIRSQTSSGISLSGMTATISAGTTTLNAGDAYSVQVTCNDAANNMHLVSVDITYDRP